MNGANCLIVSDDLKKLIKEIRDNIPQAKGFTDEDLKAKIGANQTPNGELPSLDTIRKSFAESKGSDEAIDYSALDEIANLKFRNAQRRADRVNLIARLFSQTATAFYNRALKDNPNLRRPTFIINNRYLISDYLRNVIFTDKAVDLLVSKGDLTEEEAKYRKEQFDLIVKNWNILCQEAANILWYTEGISFSDKVKNGEENDDNTPDGENEASLKDGWLFKARELDLRDTLSTETRKILSSIRLAKRDGTFDSDDLGFARYLNPDQAHLTLLEKISTINSSDEFIPALQELARRHPWVNQVLKAIEEDEKNSAFPTIGPKLYNDLRKELLPYYVQVTDSKGKLVTKQVNRTPSIFYLLDNWRMMFEQGTVLSDYSIYNKKGEYSKENAEKGKKVIADILSALNRVDFDGVEGVINSSVPRISKLLNMVGIDFSDEEIIDTIKAGEKPVETTKSILSALSTIFDQVSKKDYKPGTDLINEFSGAFSEIATLFNVVPNGAVIATFREAGRTRQSYSAPSYLGRMLNGIKNDDEGEVAKYLRDTFGRFRQFKDESGWRNEWLKLLASDKKFRSLLERKIVIHREGKKFDDWSESDYTNVAMTEFFESPNIPGIDSAYYPLPLLADAPSAEFIRFTKYTDNNPDYILPDGSGFMTAKDIILDKLTDVAMWELERIQLVKSRQEVRENPALLKEGESVVAPIACFDGSRGLEFCFFPFLNDPAIDIKSQLKDKSITDQRAILRDLIKAGEETSFEEFYNSPNSEAAKEIYDRNKFESFFYNNAFAYTQMVQMLTTDLAYYKDLNDFQKRFKEVYAMTNRLYTSISDISKTRTVVNLTDIEFKSPLLEDVKDVLASAFDRGNISEPQMKYILGQWEASKINVTDAQGFVTLNAYKKVMRMIGNWTEEMEAAKQRLESGDFEFKDFDIIWQTIKPFTFTFTTARGGALVQDSDGSTSPYGDLKVPVQYKNSEFLLLAIYNSIARSQSKSPMLRALNEWATENDIDLIQFDSGVKTGGQASIDLNKAVAENWDKDSIKEYLEKIIKNPDVLHRSSWEDYGIQSATPEHLVDHEALIGSQAKKLIFADISDSMEIYLQNHKFNKQNAYQLFQALLVSGYVKGFEKCVEIFSSKENIAKAIQKEMEGSTRYTDEERRACTINPDTGDFYIPLHDPIQSSRIQQLLNSIIKKAVTKQETTGAACIQVSDFGLTNELNVRFKDANGNLLPTRNEWLKDNPGKSEADYVAWREGLKKSGAASIAYYECYLPAYTKKFFSSLRRTNGNFDINSLPEELRRCIGYRIPTESKYSMQPIYIKGFLPQQNGSAIMLPAEITHIVGSDFDIDKVYLMLPSVGVGSKARDEAKKEFDSLNKKDDATDSLIASMFGEIEEEDSSEYNSRFKEWLKEQQENGRFVVENGEYNGKPDFYVYRPSINLKKFITTKSDGSLEIDYKGIAKQPKSKRDNLLLDIFWEVLRNPDIPQQIIKPGGFDEASKNAAIMTVLRNMSSEELCKHFKCKTLGEALTSLLDSSKKDAKKLAESSAKPLNPLSFSTQTYFHSQNSNGGKMIGVYAVGNASHSIGEWGTTQLKQPMQFLEFTLSKIDEVKDFQGGLISENLANFLAASVDNVKDPVLKALNQDTTTGDVTNFLLRAGVPLPYVAAFMVAEKETNLSKEKKDTLLSVPRTDRPMTLENVLKYINTDWDSAERDLMNAKEEGRPAEEIEKLQNRVYEFNALHDGMYANLSLLYDSVKRAARDLTQITQAFRGDAMSSAPGPSIGHNIVRILKLEALRDKLQSDDKFSFTTDLLSTEGLLDENFDILALLEDSMKQKVPFVFAATKCGVTGTSELLSSAFPQLNTVLLSLATDKATGLSRYVDLTRMSGDDAAKLIDTFYSELFLYLLSGTQYFGSHNGGNSKENLKYYLTEFPKKLGEMKAKYPEIFNTNSLTKNLYVSKKGDFPRILFSNSGNLTKGLKGTISNDWAMLLVDENPEIRDFGFELFKYATFSGLEFSGASSFIQLAPNILRVAIRDYDKTIRNITTNPSGLSQFVWQFVHNHLNDGVFYQDIEAEKLHLSSAKNSEGETIGTKFNLRTNSDFKAIYRVHSERVDSNGKVEHHYDFYEVSDVQVISSGGTTTFNVTYSFANKTLGIPYQVKEYYFGEAFPDTIISSDLYSKVAKESRPIASYDNSGMPLEDDFEAEEDYISPTSPVVSTYDERGNRTTICF